MMISHCVPVRILSANVHTLSLVINAINGNNMATTKNPANVIITSNMIGSSTASNSVPCDAYAALEHLGGRAKGVGQGRRLLAPLDHRDQAGRELPPRRQAFTERSAAAPRRRPRRGIRGPDGVAQPGGREPQGIGQGHLLLQQQAHQPRKLRPGASNAAAARPGHAVQHRPNPAYARRLTEASAAPAPASPSRSQATTRTARTADDQLRHRGQRGLEIVEYLLELAAQYRTWPRIASSVMASSRTSG